MKEPLAWYCECGSTVKFSGVGLNGEADERIILDRIINYHARTLRHETVTADEARLIRQRYREHKALSC